MAYYKIEDSKLTAIADAIRSKINSSDAMTIDEMPGLIATLPALATYTNMLKKAVDTSKNPYNGGKGWKENTYLSWNGLTESSSTNYDVTGWMPAKAGDVIRLKNVQLCKNVNGTSKCLVSVVKSDFSAYNSVANWLTAPSAFSSAWSAVTNADGTDVVQFTIPTSWSATAYFRMCCGALTDKSVITVNEEIN